MVEKKLLRKKIKMPNGTWKYISGWTKAELEEKALKIKLQLGMGIDLTSDLTVGELCEMWWVARQPRLRSENSRQAVLLRLNNYILPMLSAYPVRQVQPMQIAACMRNVSDLSKSVQTHLLQDLRSIFSMAQENGLIVRSPVTSTIKAGGRPTVEKVPLTEKQAADLLSATKGTRAYPFIAIGLMTGMRRGEILGLRWNDIDFEENIITVRHNAIMTDNSTQVVDFLKTDSGRRNLPMPSALASFLISLKDESKSQYVISMENGDPLTKASFRALWEIVNRRRITDEKEKGSREKHAPNVCHMIDFHVTPHILRHTYATRLFDAGIDLKTVQYLMGHASSDITLRVYIHYQQSKKAEESAKLVEGAFTGMKL